MNILDNSAWFSNAILFIGIFLLTLVSHTIYAWAIGLAFVLLFLIIEQIPIKKKAIYESLFLFFLIIIAVIRFQLFLTDDVLPLYGNAFWGKTANFTLCVLVWFSIRLIALDDKKDYLTSLIAPLLKLHVAIFFLQSLIFLSTGNYIDFVAPFTGIESRYASFSETFAGIGGFRPTGLYVEPSTYFLGVLTLAILLLINDGFSKHKKLFGFTIVSMYLSFSTAAVIIATIFVFYLIYSQELNRRFYVITSVAAIVLLVVSTSKINKLYQSQIDRLDSRASDMRVTLVKIVANRDFDKSITAYGAYATDDKTTKLTNAKFGNRDAGAINDAGLFIFMWARFGYLGIIYFVILCIWQYKVSKNRFWLFLILSLTKISLFHPLFVFYFALSVTDQSK